MLKQIVIFCLFLTVSVHINGQIQLADKLYYTDEDRSIFNSFLSEMESKKSLPTDQLIIETAGFFIGTPYVASTLEKEPEGLVINLREMDCSTLVENVIALVHTIKEDHPSFENFCKNLQAIRYREGKINNYTDRIHYTSDWVFENDRKKIVRDITKETGGISYDINLNFISTHPDSYKQLKNNSQLVSIIAAKEREINARDYYYIPKNDLDAYADKIKPGDIVCFTTAIKGLDISHMGFIYRDGNKLTFIHASSLSKKVIINKESLKQYLLKGKNNTGIMVARPL